jgi:hypothetical protein
MELAVLLLRFRRSLIEEYGDGLATMMLIDRAVAACKDFIRVEGWIGNLALLIEHEFFGTLGPSAHFQDRYARTGGTIRRLTVEQHLARLCPLAERCERAMREALGALERLSDAPSLAVEKSKQIKISVIFGSDETRAATVTWKRFPPGEGAAATKSRRKRSRTSWRAAAGRNKSTSRGEVSDDDD